MEFTGRIMKVLQKQEGVSERTGNAWAQQSFVFEYFEDPNQRYSDKVVLQTFDTKIMEQLEENAQVRIGFGHGIREYIRDGKTSVFNEPRMYKFERLDAAEAAPQPAPQTEQPAAAPFPPAQQPQSGEKEDDLPF